MGLFRRTPYHFPEMKRLGEWEWDTESMTWTLHLHPGSRNLLGLRLTQDFMMFGDARIKYSHLAGMTMHLEDLISATITVSGVDGREYLWNRMSEHWRGTMNSGKRIEPPSELPYPVGTLPMWTESSKDFYYYLR